MINISSYMMHNVYMICSCGYMMRIHVKLWLWVLALYYFDDDRDISRRPIVTVTDMQHEYIHRYPW